MKRFVLIAIGVMIVLALGLNWYFTREIRQQLDRAASAVSFFGTLTYDSVRLSPRGAIHINNLAFFPRRGSGQGVEVRRIAFRTGSLGALLSLERNLEAGRLPERLGIGVEGLQFSLGSLPPSPGAGLEPARGVQPAAAGLGFSAAGCEGRRGFSVDDFIDMDYFVIEADVEADYRFLEQGLQLRQFVQTRSAEIGAVDFELVVDLNAGSLSIMEVMGALQRADLNSFTFEYEDLGFYPRMLRFCARRMDMDRDAYIDHHLDAWAEQWTQLGSRPSPALVEAYRGFVESPDRLSATSRAVYNVELEMLAEYSLPQFFERMETRISFGNRAPIPVEAETVASTGPTDENEPAGPAPSPPDRGQQATDAVEDPLAMTAEQRRVMLERGRAAAEAAAAERVQSRWLEAETSDTALAELIDRPVRVDLNSGRRFVGRLERVDADRLHIRFISDSGFYVRPVARNEVRNIAVRTGVP
jgi:hypothetical protein